MAKDVHLKFYNNFPFGKKCNFKFCHNRKISLLMAVATTIMVVTSIFKTFAYLSEQSTRLFHDFHEMANPYIHTIVTLCKNSFKINSKIMHGAMSQTPQDGEWL